MKPEGWKRIKGKVGLYFACKNKCTDVTDKLQDSMINPSDLQQVGTPICPNCDRDMELLGVYIKED